MMCDKFQLSHKNIPNSLDTKGSILIAAENKRDAVEAFLKGINTLSRLFLGNPGPFSQLMVSLLQYYGESCEAAGIEPKAKVLSPIKEKLNAMKKDGGGRKRKK